ncbi:MAG: bifunctional (p)ppGpp synthetase/guanosine-3',5'-bis(diphosphate) 3'-pyrophosphohydrolase [bacterium]|nr:bifunctional (p)ppGpp synthetase/guanosine-3',5'-bis(diphosphate) 3'-pyrophosphohydrolase [bacterium]
MERFIFPNVTDNLTRYRLPVGMMNLAEFIIHIESMNANISIPVVRKAYEFSNWAHKGQKRASGEPYIEHCLNVAFILAEQHLDGDTVAAGLLHDIVEDCNIGINELAHEFSPEIAALVDGVTKLGAYQMKSRAENQADYFRKMLISMANDIRVILIKLADRLHNMRTLEYLPHEKQLVIATETRDVYAPLAHRFGMAKIKWELEDLSLKYIKADVYRYLMERIDLTRSERETYIQDIVQTLTKALTDDGVAVEITGRAKHFDSIYRKMVKRQKPFEEIYDLIAIRVVTPTVKDCYHALGVIHNMWTPVADRFHDYIATPKQNMYQSLHTTVVGPNGRMVEIQIRTPSMHYVAEYGIAAHWLYKEGKHVLEESDRQLSWLREVLDWQKDMTNPEEFMEFLKIDLFHDEVFVFTPNGELKHLPLGATALDFAFAVHTNVGVHCVGTKVNGRLVPFETVLKSGDEVEVMTSPHAEPSRDWLKVCKTTSARAKIRKYMKQKGFDESYALGKEMFERAIKKRKLKYPSEEQLDDAAMALSYTSSEQMLAKLGSGDLALGGLMSKLFPQEEETQGKPSIIKKFVDKARGGKGIRVEGMGNMMFRFANCCQPVPGERIVGFITRGRGLSIHRADCVNAIIAAQEPERKVEVSWDVGGEASFLVRLAIVVEYRKNILYDITEVVANCDAEVRGAELSSKEAIATGHFVIEIKNISHLNRVIAAIRKKISRVIKIDRVFGGETDQGEPNESNSN